MKKKGWKKVEPLENLADGKPVGQIVKRRLAIFGNRFSKNFLLHF